MKIEKIKPIPKYIQRLIQKKDLEDCKEQNGIRRFYSYLTKNDGELVKVTVAVRNRYGKWHCKQVAVHGVNSDISFSKDLNFFYTGLTWVARTAGVCISGFSEEVNVLYFNYSLEI